jgi:hypothetical protein
MASSCNFRTSEASTKAWFRTRGLLDQYLNIPEGKLNDFRMANGKWSAEAENRYGIKGRLFTETNGGKKAIPNTELFQKIDFIKMNGVEDPEIDTIYKEKLSPSKSLEDFRKEAREFISLMLGSGLTKQETLEKLNCL